MRACAHLLLDLAHKGVVCRRCAATACCPQCDCPQLFEFVVAPCSHAGHLSVRPGGLQPQFVPTPPPATLPPFPPPPKPSLFSVLVANGSTMSYGTRQHSITHEDRQPKQPGSQQIPHANRTCYTASARRLHGTIQPVQVSDWPL